MDRQFRTNLLILLGTLTTGAVLLVAADDSGHAAHANAVPAGLVEKVRDAMGQFINVNVALVAGYHPLFGCVHYLRLNLAGDGETDASKPEALIYEPSNDGLRLAGVEFILDAAAWMNAHDGPPVLEGQLFWLVSSPNRFGLSAFFELHVRAWRENPNGAFVDWNNHVSCEGQQRSL